MNKIEDWLQGVKHMDISIRVNGTNGWVERCLPLMEAAIFSTVLHFFGPKSLPVGF